MNYGGEATRGVDDRRHQHSNKILARGAVLVFCADEKVITNKYCKQVICDFDFVILLSLFFLSAALPSKCDT